MCGHFVTLSFTCVQFDDDDELSYDPRAGIAGFALNDESISADLLSDLRHAMEPTLAMEEDAPASKPTGVNTLKPCQPQSERKCGRYAPTYWVNC